VFFDPNDKNHPDFNTYKDKEIYLFDNEKELTLTLQKAVESKVINNQALAFYMYLTQEFLLQSGIDPQKFRFRKHGPNELAHYAQECWDAEIFSERFGWVECVGIADRSAYDLNSHIESSGTDMYALKKYETPKTVNVKKIVPKMDVLGPLFKTKAGEIKKRLEEMEPGQDDPIQLTINDELVEIPSKCYDIVESQEKEFGEKFVPHVIEPSYGIDRIIYCILEHNFKEIQKKEEEYRLFSFSPLIAPIKAGVLPLINDERLVSIAKKMDEDLRKAGIATYFDDGGTIGRRYARMDEVGTPFCITVDHETLEDNTVTIRDRDTTKQQRMEKEELILYIKKKINQ
jgi:glycyl-tRNA synthetase